MTVVEEESDKMEVEESYSSSSTLLRRKTTTAKRRRNIVSDIESRYGKYNTCRSFPPGVYKKHINLKLIQKRATDGLMVFRPRDSLSITLSNTPSYISQVLSKLREKGNRAAMMNLP